MRALVLVSLLFVTACDRGPADCTYDRDAMMALDYRAFDQDIPRGGWRSIGRHDECATVAFVRRDRAALDAAYAEAYGPGCD